MLTIRFSRVGKKNHAHYRIVVAEHSSPVKGRFLEEVGVYDPHLKQVNFKKERIDYWLSQGVKTSDSVWNLLIKEGIVSGEKRKVNIKKKESAKAAAGEATNEKEESKAVDEGKTEEEPKKEEKSDEKIDSKEDKKSE
ncbi:MAG TPA: 30S ribosomal protein S16 [Candidatus Moranbacteria bacterium]|nr:30S ribosomal protein S16 [Candidatus Moranbacteria bacterium]